jgi:hypothetical protein
MDIGEQYKAKKAREGKPPLQKLDPNLLEGMARVCDMGDKKHADTHWTLGLPWSAVVGALKRHISEIEKGNITDPESGESHLFHVAVNVMFLNYYLNRPEKYAKNNDLIFWEKEKIDVHQK